MSDRLMKLGLLGQLRQQLAALENRAEGIIDSIQRQTFVMTTVWALDGEKVRDYGRELLEVLNEGNAMRKRIEDLELDVGIKY